MRPSFIQAFVLSFVVVLTANSQQPVPLSGGSYASYVPLTASYTSGHGGCQAYQMEHRTLYLPDSLLERLGHPNGSRQGSVALPTNDWWTYALVNDWTGKIWMYPGWVEATDEGVDVGYPTYWEPSGCEVKWDTPLRVTFTNTATGKKAAFKHALVDAWSDFMMSFIMQDGDAWVRVTCVHGSPLVWLEADGITMQAANPNTSGYWVKNMEGRNRHWMVVGLKTDGLTNAVFEQYASRVPRTTRFSYDYRSGSSSLTTTFTVWTEDITDPHAAPSGHHAVLLGLIPHHYYNIAPDDLFINNNVPFTDTGWTYLTPRGTMHLFAGNDFTCLYPVHPMLPFFPAPMEWKDGFSQARMMELNADYAKRGTFGGDTYWGGKGLTQMAHYMTFALQMGDTATFRMAKQRLKEVLIDWYTYTPGEARFYFARYPKWGALVGMDPSYDSDTFNDHHFHYGYFVYASAILCLLDEDFRTQYGPMAREVARDYANWQRTPDEPWFRTLDPYCGHSFAGGMGNGGNGNGQESTSEAIQGWGGVWMLGAALQDDEMLEAGIMGYTLETRATAEYWFDRKRRNIDFTRYNHPYCCNLTMQGVGWWTWFSGDPVWMHSIQWLPISPVLTNHFCEDLPFTRWDYTEMYKGKEVGDYEAESGGLGDESGLGNVCLSYLSLFDADSAARVWDRMDKMGKALAKNPDTGGITYWLAHSHKALGEKRYDISADHPLACAYTDTLSRRTTYAVYNVSDAPLTVHFFGAEDTSLTVPNGLTLVCGTGKLNTTTIEDERIEVEPDPLAWDLPYPNLALHKPVTASSEENAGCLAVNLTDGDVNSRWGSAHRDNEYVIVDLQQQCYIDHLILRWETAYASEYELALSDDQSEWHTVTLSSAGGVEKVQMSNLQPQMAHPSRGRYIRLTGLQRATQYGTSLYELEAYGRPLSGDPDKVFAIALSASDTVLYQGGTTTLSAIAYNVNGGVLNVAAAYAVTAGEAQLNGNRVTCPCYGSVTVTATVEGLSASLTLIVLETEQATAAEVHPKEVTMPVGTEQKFVVCIVNQFGAASDSCETVYRATQVGDYELVFPCFGMRDTAIVHVQAFDEVNLALDKPVTASGFENAGTVVANAVDGDLTTRWSSRHQDNEWIAVDLENCYLLTAVKLFWEAAYATSYDIELSDDGEDYHLAKAVTGAEGGVQTVDIRHEGQAVPARFVRVLCKTRNTGYGSSLWEMEVYGESLCEPLLPLGIEQVNESSDQSSNQSSNQSSDQSSNRKSSNRKFIHNGYLYISHDGIVFTVDGRVCLHAQE